MGLIQVEEKKMTDAQRLNIWHEYAKAIVAGGRDHEPSSAVAQKADALTREYEKRWVEAMK